MNKYLDKIAAMPSLRGVVKSVGNFAKNVSGENLRAEKAKMSNLTSVSKSINSYSKVQGKAHDAYANQNPGLEHLTRAFNEHRHHMNGVEGAHHQILRDHLSSINVGQVAKNTRNSRLAVGGVGIGAAVAAKASAKKKD